MTTRMTTQSQNFLSGQKVPGGNKTLPALTFFRIQFTWTASVCLLLMGKTSGLRVTRVRKDRSVSISSPKTYLPIIFSDAIVVHPALKAHRNRPLPWTALTFTYQKTAIYATAEEVLGGIPWNKPMIPGVLIQAVHWGDVVARHPPYFSGSIFHFTPFAPFVVANHGDLFPWNKQTPCCDGIRLRVPCEHCFF